MPGDRDPSGATVWIFVFGVVFVVALLGMAIAFPTPTPFQYTVFRIVLALASAGIAALIPGFLHVALSNAIRASGALAVFVIVYFFSPAELVTSEPRRGSNSISAPDPPVLNSSEYRAVPLHPSLGNRISFVSAAADAFYLGLVDPNEIVRLSRNGDVIGSPSLLEGEPTAVAATKDILYVATRHPAAVIALTSDLQPLRQYSLPSQPVALQDLGTTSREPTSIAVDQEDLWVVTEGNGTPVLYHLDTTTGQWMVPPYYDGFYVNARGWQLRRAWDQVFAVATETTPASVFRLSRSEATEFRGHDIDIVSCTTDLRESPNADAFVLSCDNELLEINLHSGEIPRVARRWGTVTPAPREGGWINTRIAFDGGTVFVAQTRYQQQPWIPLVARLTAHSAGGAVETLFQKLDAEITDIAVEAGAALLVIRTAQGGREAWRVLPAS